MDQDITLDIVREMHQNARFFKNEQGRDQIEISFVGSKDTIIHDVAPKHMAAFREEWNAYCDGRPAEKRKGTPLTDVKGIDSLRAEQLVNQNVHTAEELAALNDMQVQMLGHGTLTARREARGLLEMRAGQQASAALDRIQEATKKMGVAPAAPAPEVAELKAEVSELKGMIGDLVKALSSPAMVPQPKRRGRPPKDRPEEQVE